MLGSGWVRAQSGIKLPDFGDSSSTALAGYEERKLGDAFLREIRASAETLDDPEIDGYIKQLGYRLVAASDQSERSFTFFVLRDPAINAFAGPGGVIGIHTGLVLAAESEGELAAVLAHEIAHVTQHHIARAYEQAGNFTVAALAGILAAVVLGTQNPKAGGAAMAAVVGGQAQMQINFIRANEQEADRVGIDMLARAGFDPHAMPAFFERLQESSRYYTLPPEFLSTHPVTSSRIADSRARAERYKYKQYQDSEAFHRVRARLKILDLGPKKALAEFETSIRNGSGHFLNSAEYGKALALIQLRRFEEAARILERLRSVDPEVLPYQDALARTLAARGDYAAAVAIYREALKGYLYERQMSIGLARTWLAAGRPLQAVEVLNDYTRNQPPDSLAYKLLAKSHERAGQAGSARVALAEHYYLNGNLDQAVFQLEQATRAGDGDYYQQARIAARLKIFKRERAERDAG